MEGEELGSRTSSSFAPAPRPEPEPARPPPPPSSSKHKGAPNQRQRFAVELRPGETTIVSWKRLVKDSRKSTHPPPAPDPPCGAHPALESRIAPAAGPGPTVEDEGRDALPPPNRFSAVIEKIERLYMGTQSSDEEELDDVPDEDDYDTEDSFIDDAELDEYFQVDKLSTKHNGFFVNRGKLERINEHVSSPKDPPKKRRRKDSTKHQNEVDGEHLPNKHVKLGNMRMKGAPRSEPLMGSKLSSPSKISLSLGKNCQEVKSISNQLNVPPRSSKKKSIDLTSRSEYPSVEAPNKDSSAFPMEPKHIEKQKSDVVQSRDLSDKVTVTSESSDALYQACHNKGVSMQDELHPRKILNGSNEIELSTKIQHREKSGGSVLPDTNSSGSKHPIQRAKSKSTLTKEGSSVRPKGTLLERAIQDLETTVAESRPPTIEVQEADGSSQGVKRRLPPEVKQKLAKVARLASSQGIISEELINRLMSILGHVVQLKTLKRNLKKMVELGLSAEQEKDDRFRQLKKDVVEMIRIQTSFLRSKVSFGSMQEYLQYALSPQLRICLSQMKAAIQQDGSSDDFQDVHHGSDEKGRYGMDDAMEDKICDLYDLYVEGMDEDKGPHIRKLYVELAELWPSGTMDKCGIKCAINRAKVRKRLLYSRLKEEKMKRKKISAAAKMEETTRGEGNVNAQPRPAQERLATDSSRAFMPNDKPTSSLHLPTSGKTSNPPLNASSLDRPRQEKVRVSINMVDEASNGKTTDVAVLKKKVKRKPESNLGENNFRPVKLPPPLQLHGEERHKSHKLAPNHHHKSSHQSAILQHCEQPS
ncbi:ubinuclein-1-like isoform X2 [Magnolia sinica]|uniref:ubinuclein-1-like isoform X2 n=1 Tax=Magnolia sinica TaxID=86752 RepID=UPI002659B6A2|nr:ubinuclein-1-like isoform X2 [Magnolia sinica]